MRLPAITIAALAAATAAANGQIVYSGVVNLNVPATFDGLEIDVVTGDTSTDFTTATGDLNIYDSSGNWQNFGRSANGGVFEDDVTGDAIFFAMNDAVGGGAGVPGGTFTTLAADGSGANGIIGFQFFNEAGGTNHFGWALIDLPDVGDGTLISYAFEATPDTPIAAGAIPVPFWGYGRIDIRFDPEMVLPDGLMLPLTVREVVGSYQEGQIQ